MFSRICIAFFLTMTLGNLAAQDVKVHGHFEMDSLKIGEAVPYSLTVHYPSALNLILPDTTYSFAPFEFEKKQYFPTRTKGNVSYDSVVYFLTSYEIDQIQTLKMPAFVINAGDCTTVDSNTDTIFLKQLVKEKLDSMQVQTLPLKVNTDYLNVSWLLNYPLLLIIGGIVIAVLIALWFIFGKRIILYYKLKRLNKNHAAFLEKFSTSVGQLQQDFSPAKAESVLVIWKKYMENLVSRPYTNYTSREILRLEKDEKLGHALQLLNKIIYAGINSSSEEPFTDLRAYTEQQYTKKIEEVKHA